MAERLHLADIFASDPTYPSRNRCAAVVRRAFFRIMHCRTGVMGGVWVRCINLHDLALHYFSCHLRGCPRCGYVHFRKWMERQFKILLGCAHHHMIFTLPHQFNPLWARNFALLADLLFSSVSESLLTIARDPRWLGATPGFLATLHTWGQPLTLHPHLHVVCSAGGADDQGQWVPSRRAHFLPAEPLRQVFRGKFLDGMLHLAESGKLRLPDDWSVQRVRTVVADLRQINWNVHVREAYSDPTAVLSYLGRYVYGGPIGERRLLALDRERATVTFAYRDYRRDRGVDGEPNRVMTLPREAFIRRFLQHVAPKGFHTVRGFGLYRRGGNTEALNSQIRLAHEAVPLTDAPFDPSAAITPSRPRPKPPLTCPYCAAKVESVPIPRLLHPVPATRAGPNTEVAA